MLVIFDSIITCFDQFSCLLNCLVLMFGALQAKRILRNFQAVENKSSCKGEAMLLATRIDECEACCTILEAIGTSSKVSYDTMMKALLAIQDNWHHLATSHKAKIAMHHVSQQLASFSETDDGTSCDGITRNLCPVSVSESVFDGANPSIHAAYSELTFAVKNKWEDHELDAEDNEGMVFFKKAAEARKCWDFGALV